jgi:hypothetical protein
MQYVNCPRCRARFRTGAIHERLPACPRCGAPFQLAQAGIGARLRQALRLRAGRDAPDWETITAAQYARRHVRRRHQPEH